MRKMTVLLLAFITLSLCADAQVPAEVEVFGGYSLEHVAPCGTNNLGCSAEGTGQLGTVTFNGWNASVTGYLYGSLGVTADFGGHYGSNASFGSVHRYSYLFGPAYALRLRTVTVFGRALFGGVSQTSPSTVIDMNYNRFMLALGGGLDLKVSSRFAVRPLQLDYERHGVPAFASTNPTNGLRYSAGVIARF
jgi:hypothetical protein